jgi:aminoglycoside 6'-N-acetyltransferase
MKITFASLAESHFLLLFKWLEAPHIKAWWDKDIKWTPKLIEEKYSNYTNGSKSVHCYIICYGNNPIGYIQYYNVRNFPREYNCNIMKLPNNCAAVDLYIGEAGYLNKGIGSKALNQFLESHVFQSYDYVFVDPDATNIAAIRAYEKAGFKIIQEVDNGKVTWMIKNKPFNLNAKEK